MAVHFDPMDEAFLRDPYPTYASLREESPVHRLRFGPWTVARTAWRFARASWRENHGPSGLVRALRFARQRRRGGQTGPRGKIFALSRHADVVEALRDADRFSSKAMGGGQIDEERELSPTRGSLISIDPPEHRQHRNIVNQGFTPRRIAALEPGIRKIADELVSEFETEGHCELISAFANPLPVSVIVDLLGLPREKRDDFKRWTNELIVQGTRPDAVPPIETMREFRAYMSEEVERRRADPSDDLISLLVNSQDEGVLDTDQVIGFASLLLAAGSETTTNLIGNVMMRLHEQPETLARVRANPALIPQALDESLRLDPPVQLLMRIATRDTEIGGVEIPEGSMVIPLLASANRDPDAFPNPDAFDIDRDTSGHVGFGWGNHFCLGSALAKLESRIALETLLERLPHHDLQTPVEMHGSFLIRGPKEMRLSWPRRGPSRSSHAGTAGL
jgi:cytochrome P450